MSKNRSVPAVELRPNFLINLGPTKLLYLKLLIFLAFIFANSTCSFNVTVYVFVTKRPKHRTVLCIVFGFSFLPLVFYS